MAVSRREFLNTLASTLGTGALLKTGAALGFLPFSSQASVPVIQPGKATVAILGGGISGLTTAYELQKAGYDVHVLEASHRAGGRVMTVRSGDIIDEIGNRQVCEFDNEPHLYFNCGAARIPSTHHNLLNYCKELGVELEIFINENKHCYFQDDNVLNGKPIRNGEYSTHVRGFLAELFAKCFTKAELNTPFTEKEIESIYEVITSFGDLNEDKLYKGSLRAGFASGGFLDHGSQKHVVALNELLKSPFAHLAIAANEGETGPVLLQPVGGMDMIIKGFLKKLGDRVQYNSPITGLSISDKGVDIQYSHKGKLNSLKADFCFNCIPSHLMTGLKHNFPSDYLTAMKYIRRGEAYKAAFQAKTRFWEDDNIYGGITWVNAPIQQIWYPPQGTHKAKGVILAAYDFGSGMHFTKMTQEQRIEALLQQGEKVHPNYRNQVEKGITIAWHRINHMLGCSARWSRNYGEMSHEEETLMQTLIKPVAGRHYFIGDQVSVHIAWQESAILSAHRALNDFNSRRVAEAA